MRIDDFYEFAQRKLAVMYDSKNWADTEQSVGEWLEYFKDYAENEANED